MLRASSVLLTLTVTDIEEALTSYAVGSLQDLKVTLENGALLVNHKVTVDRVPMAVPIDLRFTLRVAEGTQVELGVTWTNMGLVPAFVKEKALQKAFESLPGTYEDGLYRLDLSEVLDQVPVSFRIKGIQITRSAIVVELADVIAFPIDAAGLVTTGSTALVPVPSEEEQAIPEHQSFYQSLREKAKRYATQRGPKWAEPLIPWILAIPDFFVMAVRLARDPRVPAGAKVIAGAMVAYFLSPIDLIPDVIPIIGQVDDLALALLGVEQIIKVVPRHVVQEAWPGEGEIVPLVQHGLDLVTRVLPLKVLDALRRVLTR